ncbi:unnamed protein product [Durusdinium trenchii]|uniref:Sfi1 spindle body domain-containing protein n=1 Tax=Durusdinium trenchii TaxID=1381693 RepID=A0ABP0M0I5_9DINO
MSTALSNFEALHVAFSELFEYQKLLSQECHALRHATYLQDLWLISCLQAWQEVAQTEAEKAEHLRNLLPYWQAWRDFAQAEKTARHAALQTLLRDSFCGWHDFAATEKAARHATLRLLLHCLRIWRDFAKAEKAERVVKGEKLTEAPPQPPLETEVEETPPEDSPLTTAVAETSSTWTETVEKVEEIKGKKREETEVPSKEEEYLLSLRWSAKAFRRRTRLALARFAWLKAQKTLRFLLSCTLWRWFLTASRRRCLGARSALRRRYQSVANWHNMVAAFHRWRSLGKSKRYLVAVDLSDHSRLRYHLPHHHRLPRSEPVARDAQSPWLRLLRRVAFNGWAEAAVSRGRRMGILLKDRLELGAIDWLRRRAACDDRLAKNLYGELRDETVKLHLAIEELDGKVKAFECHRVLRGCWRLWRHGRAWCDTALLPLAMRHWLSLALVRWAVLARQRQLPRWSCGRRLMMQEALASRAVWSCFAAWHLGAMELSASTAQGQLQRCVKALGAFDVHLLRLCPEITATGLAALQVQLVDLSRLLQENLSNVKLNIPRPQLGFPSRRCRYWRLLLHVTWTVWRTKAAELRKAKRPYATPLLRLTFATWRHRAAALRRARLLLRRRAVARQLWRDQGQLERELTFVRKKYSSP